MKPKLTLKLAALVALLAGAGITANAQVFLGGQLGSPAYQGSVTTNANGTLTILAGGDDIWNSADNGYFYYTWAQGDWDAKVRVDSLDVFAGGAANAWRKAEMMVRWSDPAYGVRGGDAFIAMMLAPDQGNGFGLQYRPDRDKGANNVGGTDTVDTIPAWLRLTRTNNIFTVRSSADGITWTVNGTVDVTSTANGFGRAWPDLVTVGVAITAHDNAAANSVTAVCSAPTISASKAGWIAPTTASISRNVSSATVREGCEASFSFVAVNNAVPVAFPNQYQWYKNGALAAGLTRSSIAWLAAAADNGSQYKCVSWPQGFPSVTVTSAVGTLTVNSTGIITNGFTKLEVFAGSSRADIYAGNVPPGDTGNRGVAGKLRWLGALQDGGGYGDNTSRRYSGWFVPPANGDYTFYLASDDDTDMWISTDATPANKRIICQEMGWSGYNNWTNSGGAVASDIAQKCSNTWTNGDGVSPNPTGIPLVGGNRYYYEMVLHNGGGGDNGSLTAQLYSDPPPQDGSATRLTNSVLQVISWQPTTFTWSLQPQSQTFAEGQPASFRATATSDGEFAPNYQWQRYGTNIPGATQSSFTIDPVQLSDSGAVLACVATIPMMAPITTTNATLTVEQAVFEPGFMVDQKWLGVQNRVNAAAGTLGDAGFTDVKPGMAAAIVSGEAGSAYTRKISGFFIPPATDRYFFYTTSDDYSDLYISTGVNPANKYMIAQETGWSGVLNWTGVGAGVVSQKSSQTWTNASGVAPYASGIQLTAGQKYYMEVDQEEGSGGDNVAVTYGRAGDGYVPVAGNQPRMVGSVIGFNAPKCNAVWFTLEPTNPPPIVSGPNTATFYAFGSSDSKLMVGNITGDDSTPPTIPQYVFFQWAKNGVDIPGATASSYTTPWLLPSDNGAQFACKMRALGYGLAPSTQWWSNSTPATLTVTTDTTVPQVVYSGYWTDAFGVGHVTVTFNTIMDPATATNSANYTIPGVTVTGIELSRNDGRRVTLTTSAPPTFPLNISFTGIKSWSGVALAATSVAVNQSPLTPVDLGLDSGDPNYYPDPMYPSKLWLDGPKAYTIAAQGSDIWNNADGFNFLYEQKNGDFDVVLRQTTYSLGNRWAKVGLMLREQLIPGSRNWNIVNDPPNLPCLSDGNGANAVECNWRTNTVSPIGLPSRGSDSSGWGNGTGMAPQYPNAWVRLKRQGQVVSAYGGSDGMNWTELARMDVSTRADSDGPMPASMYIGIATTGHHNDVYGIPYDQQLYWNYASVDNYSSSYVAPPPSKTLSVTRSGSNLIVTWTPTGGTLESSSDLKTWAPVAGATSPATIPIGAGPAFYRVSTPFTP